MTTVKAGMYQRNGALVTPGIMSFDGKVLSFKTAEDTVLESDLSELRAEFSTFGALSVFHGEDKYVFVTGAHAGAFAPQFSEAQMKEIAASENSVSLAVKMKGESFIFAPNNPDKDIAKLLNGGKGYGLVGLTVAELQRRAFYITLAWAKYLKANGLQVAIKGTTYAKTLYIGLVVVLVIVAVMSVVMYTVFDSFLS